MLRDGHIAHHVENKPIMFMKSDSSLTTYDKDVAKGLAHHLKMFQYKMTMLVINVSLLILE